MTGRPLGRRQTTHVHVKVHLGGTVVHTGQLYFDDTITDAVYALEPYAARGSRGTRNATDVIHARGGAESMLALRRRRRGWVGRITLVVSRASP